MYIICMPRYRSDIPEFPLHTCLARGGLIAQICLKNSREFISQQHFLLTLSFTIRLGALLSIFFLPVSSSLWDFVIESDAI